MRHSDECRGDSWVGIEEIVVPEHACRDDSTGISQELRAWNSSGRDLQIERDHFRLSVYTPDMCEREDS